MWWKVIQKDGRLLSESNLTGQSLFYQEITQVLSHFKYWETFMAVSSLVSHKPNILLSILGIIFAFAQEQLNSQ